LKAKLEINKIMKETVDGDNLEELKKVVVEEK
jgi:hypothetical protein